MMLAATFLIPASPAAAWPSPPLRVAQCDWRPVPALCKLHYWVAQTWRREDLRGIPRTRYWYTAERHPQWSPWHRRRHRWHMRAQRVAAIPLPPWPAGWLRQAVCIHEHEGAWNDEGAPYYGGMQFLLSTWAAHGGLRFGTNPALLPPRTQLTVAFWTWRDDGGSWREWGTAASCGLS